MCYRYIVIILTLLWPMASVVAGHAIHAEAVGVVEPTGDPQPTDEAEAVAIALRSILLDTAPKQATLSPAALRHLRIEGEKLSAEALRPFFSDVVIVGRRQRRGYLEVKIGATTHITEIARWAKSYENRQGPPNLRIMVIIPEYHLQRPIPDPAGETEVMRSLLAEKFRLVDQKQVEIIRYKDTVKNWKSDPKELLAIAQSWGADLLLVGEAFSQDVVNPLPGGPPACRARIEARVIRCDTAEIVASDDGEGGASDLSPAVAAKAAIRDAAKKLSDKLITSLLTANLQASQERITVVLLGVDFDRKLKFLDLLDGMKDTIKDVEERSFIDPRAELELSTSLGTGELAKTLNQAAKAQGISMKVVEQSNRKCVFDMAPVGTAGIQSSGK